MARRVCAIVPARNEADLIADTIRGIAGIAGVDEIIVVDDGSKDDTADAAENAGATQVLRIERSIGKGGALNKALPMTKADVLLLLDADLGRSAGEATKLLAPVLDGDADMTIAVFQTGPSDGPPGKLAARSGGFGIVMKTARMGIRLLTGRTIASPLAGPRAVNREIVEKAGGFAPRFGVEMALTIDALRMGYRVLEIPVHMVHRPSGRDFRGFLHRGRQMKDVLLALGRKALRL